MVANAEYGTESIGAKAHVPIFTHIFEAGEQNKHLETVSGIYDTLIFNKFDRKDILLALGGGVVGDICGFAAATYLRGIDFVQIPGNTGYFTKKIIDAIPFSLYQQDKDVDFDGSIFTEQIKNIQYISWLRNLSAPLISFNYKPTNLDNALKDPTLRPLLRKEPTDYAKAIFRQHTGVSKFWRGIDFTALPHGYAQNDLSYLPVYEESEMMTYWCSVIGKKNQNVDFMRPHHITTELEDRLSNPNIVRGLVLAKENM